MSLPKLVITDIDGVWTDGGMYYDQTGNEWKKFNTSDSAGVLFLRLLGIPTAIITGEDTKIVANRAKKLGIDKLFMGVKDKVGVANALREEMGIEWSEIAYIGDDINDIQLLKKVGFAACPSNAPGYVSIHADIDVDVAGGDGAFRRFVEGMIEGEGLMDDVLQKYFASLNFNQ